MSTATSHLQTDGPEGVDAPADASAGPGPRPVVVRRNAGLAALVGAAASAVAIAYLWRATQSGAVLDWALCAVVALIAVVHLAHLFDARTPLLVADELGVRVRLGHQWRGLPWDAVDQVRVQPARGPLHDGRLMFSPHSLGRALDGLDARGRRAAALNQRWYGAALAVPLGLGTRVPARGSALTGALVALADGRSDVVLVEPAERRTGRSAHSEEAVVDEPASEGEVVAMPGWAGPEPLVGSSATVVDLPEQSSRREETAHACEDGPDDPASAVDDRWSDPAGRAAGHDGWSDAEPREDAETWLEGTGDDPGDRPRRRGLLSRAGTAVSRLGRGRGRDVDSTPDDEGVQPGAGDELDLVAARSGAEAPYDPDEPGAAGIRASRRGEPDGRSADRLDTGPGAASDDGSALRSGPGADTWPASDTERDGSLDDAPAAAAARSTDEAGDPAADGHEAPQSDRPAARGTLSLREARHSLRAQIRHGRSAPVLGNAALLPDSADGSDEVPEGVTLRGGPAADDGRVRPISTLGEPVERLVVDEFVTEPAYDPVIGPELAAARTRVGLSVDELAERTRIRPHVIESIEVDDFAPCGGDFYARGHLRTLARVLGRDPAPLLEHFEKRYATAPISARRVFEAELATGMTGSMRSTVGGPNWLLLVGVVLALVLTWGVVRLFSSEPTETLVPVPALNGSAGIAAPKKGGEPAVAPVAVPLRVELVGAHAGTEVVVRDRAGTVVWAGRVELGGRRTVRATPPVKVHAENAGAIEVTVAGVDEGPLGQLGRPGARTYHRPD